MNGNGKFSNGHGIKISSKKDTTSLLIALDAKPALSSAEVGYEGSYKQVEDPSFYFKFKVSGSKNEFFLVWTTMPFTIITDTMLAVKPDEEYVKVQVGEEIWIMMKQRVEPVMQELGNNKVSSYRNHAG